MELWDVYDENRQKVGEPVDRNLFPKDKHRLTVHACIFNSKNQMLIQQRHSSKKTFPNVWDLTLGGCVQAGESTTAACKRELLEELNIYHDFSKEKPFLTINFDGGFDDYFLIKKDVDINTVKFTDDEVQAVKWASKDEILGMIKNKKFINYYPGFVKALFEMKERRGAFNLEREK